MPKKYEKKNKKVKKIIVKEVNNNDGKVRLFEIGGLIPNYELLNKKFKVFPVNNKIRLF